MIEYILEYVFSIFGKQNVRLVIYYGNKQGRDIDVFVVVVGESEYNCIHQNSFDITYIGEERLKSMIEHLDPLLTEPVLTGEVIYGNVNQIKKILNETLPFEGVVNYLMGKALLYFQWANTHFQNGDLIYTCDCIRFSLGFCYFAIHYHGGGKITTFYTILNESDDKRAIIDKATKMAKNGEKITSKGVKLMLAEVHNTGSIIKSVYKKEKVC